ncbi:MAG TPA: hypothetical protein VFY89_02160 [Ktedonobacterales bacterium]
MVVRRLMARLGRLLSSSSTTARAARARQAALQAGAPPSGQRSSAAPIRHHNWLEDGKRLRPPRLYPLPKAAREDGLAPIITTPLPLPAERERVISGRVRLTSDLTSDLAAITPAGGPPQEPPPPTSLPLDPLPALANLASAEATLDAAEGLDAARRRLMFMRYLVRQRIYNEGFSADELPAQYRWDSDASGN